MHDSIDWQLVDQPSKSLSPFYPHTHTHKLLNAVRFHFHVEPAARTYINMVISNYTNLCFRSLCFLCLLFTSTPFLPVFFFSFWFHFFRSLCLLMSVPVLLWPNPQRRLCFRHHYNRCQQHYRTNQYQCLEHLKNVFFGLCFAFDLGHARRTLYKLSVRFAGSHCSHEAQSQLCSFTFYSVSFFTAKVY